MKKVVIIQRIIPHYRVDFYDALSSRLASNNIKLEIIYGQESKGTVPKSVKYNRTWAIKITNLYVSFLGKEVVWQPAKKYIDNADLVIVEQANRLLFNYYLLLCGKLFGLKVAFWGHGKNFQSSNNSSFLEGFKRVMSIHSDWWFAYTEKSAQLVELIGFDALKITNVQNSIDTTALKHAKKKVSISQAEEVKGRLGMVSENIAIYCGGLYEEKKIKFLIESCKKVQKNIPDFNIIIIGDGPDSELVVNFSKENQWVHYLGEIIGDERVCYFAISKILLMPGLVGLAVLDSFALEVPMITTDLPIHSPEFEYLYNGFNGIVTKFDVDEYSQAVSSILLDEQCYLTLIAGCKESSEKYTINNMADNYSNGIISALDYID